MAERPGFEPGVELSPHTRLAGERLQPARPSLLLSMPKKAKELTALDVKRIIQPGRHAVGVIPGLLLVVKDTGAKSWILRTVIGKKRRNIGLGGYPEISAWIRETDTANGWGVGCS